MVIGFKFKIHRSPKIRKNKKRKYKFLFNKKLHINCITRKKNDITNFIQNSDYYVKFKECCQLRFYQLRKLHKLFLPILKKYKFFLWFYVHFYVSLTAKPLLRMGTGKGKFKYFVAKYRKGDKFLEFTDNFTNIYYKKRFLKLLKCVLPAHTVLVRHYN